MLPRITVPHSTLSDVAVYGVQKRKGDRHKRPWIVRWAVEGRQHSRSFGTKGEAERYRSALLIAQQRGETFDYATAVPVTWLPKADEVQVHQWARRWVAEQWDTWAPRTRTSAVEALSRFVPLVVAPTAPEPPATVRQHLVAWLHPAGTVGDEVAAAWLDRWALQLVQLTRPFLAGVDEALVRGLRGQPLGAATAARYRKVGRACLRRAVALDIIATDPWPPPPPGRSRRKAVRARRAVKVRELPDPETMAAIIDAIASHQPASRRYQVMTAVAYYAGLRPSEVVMLRARALELPAKGWGTIHVTEADVSFDEPGEPKTGHRSVPIPPVLVDHLQRWIDDGAFSPNDLLFRTRTGNRPTSSNWSRALQRGLRGAGCPSMRIYDCRHAAATMWLRAGVPLGEVAKRMGHSVETLVSTYVGALGGDHALANQRIDEALGATA